nr:beta-1,3-galactosyltransferase 1-like isoform X1 [Gasterosteus aculeatus aculeatus]
MEDLRLPKKRMKTGPAARQQHRETRRQGDMLNSPKQASRQWAQLTRLPPQPPNIFTKSETSTATSSFLYSCCMVRGCHSCRFFSAQNAVKVCFQMTPGTGTRRCFVCVVLPLMIGTVTLMFYTSSLKVPWPLMFSSNQSYNSIATTVQYISSDPPSIYHVAYRHPYRWVVDEPHRCRKESPFLVLMIPVAPHNREARDTLRNTWVKETKVLGRVISHFFLLGMSKETNGTEIIQEQMLQESQRHHDILQSDFLDSYNNLTIKTMVMFEWLSSRCPNASYAMKVDADMFLNVHNLVDMLLKAPPHLYLTGMVARHAPVIRDPTSKWYLPLSVFPEPFFPPYALGLGYVFSLDLPHRIVEASAHVKTVYVEDVSVGLCMKHLGIGLTDPPRWDLFQGPVPDAPSNCYWNSIITTIMQNSDKISQAWELYQRYKDGC